MKSILVFVNFAALFTVPVQAQQCAICEQIVSFVENWVANNESVSTIEKYLEIICTLAPDSWQQACDALVDYGVEEAIQWIIENENSTELCSQLELCGTQPVRKLGKISGFQKLKKPADGNCDICVQVVGLIENWVESNYTVEEITEYLDQICSLIPGFSDICDQMVNYGVAYIVQWLNEDENATQICQQLGFCGGKSVAAEPQRFAMPKGKRQDICDLCTQFMSLVKAYIGNNPNATVSELEQIVATLCALFPQYSQICQALADNEIQSIVNELMGPNGPQAVCSTLGLCGDKKSGKINLIQ